MSTHYESIHPTEHPFVNEFRVAWQEPTIDSLMAPLHDDVKLIQPLSPPLIGKPAASLAFRRILHRFPGIKGVVYGGAMINQVLMIEWTMIMPVGGTELCIPIIDRIELEADQVKHRIAYFDPLPVMSRVALSPSALLRHFTSLRIR